MEPATVFAGFVLYMGGLHLLWQTSDRLNKWWTKNKTISAGKQRVKRDDWYVFFHLSDLTGTAHPQKTPSHKITEKSAEKNRITPAKRQRPQA
jgi:hypothetical protein